MRNPHLQVEICCNSVTSAVNAKRGGAYRIELCQALGEGGTTPSAAAIEYCVHNLNLQTRALIRPRGGNFVYNDAEMTTILRDIELAEHYGAHAVVVGFLTPEGDIDVAKTHYAVAAAQSMQVTFHRAFDECCNPFEALEQIIECGCHQLLTSGCKPTALEGKDLIKKLVEQARGRIRIIAASGIVPGNAADIVDYTKVDAVHGSCKCAHDGVTVTDPDQVRQLFENLNI